MRAKMTGQQQAGAQLAQLQAVLDAAPAIIWTAHDRECRSITGNRAAYALSRVIEGSDLSKTGPQPDRLAHYRVFRGEVELAPEDMPIQRVAASGVPLQNDAIQFRFLDGTVRTLWGNVVPLLDEEGRPAGAIAAYEDVTERARSEEALAAGHRQTQSIIDNTPAIVYAFDLDARFVLANAALAELLHSTPEQMIGKTRHEFMPKKDADWHEANDRQVAEEGRALEFEEYSQLGRRSITWLTAKFPLRDAEGRIYAVAGISTDISERKRTEQALQESHRRLDDTLASISDAFVSYDREWRYTYANDNAVALLRTPRECLLGHTVWEAFPTAAGTEFEDHLRRCADTGQAITFEYLFPAMQTWFECSCYPSLSGMSVYFRNVTARKELEARLEERAAEIEAMMEVAPVAIWIAHDPDCRRITGNRVGYELLRTEVDRNLSRSAPPD
jgi:PAS domain S-box-containing protein